MPCKDAALTRRNFVKGSALACVGLLTGSGLWGCGNDGLEEPDADDAAGADADASDDAASSESSDASASTHASDTLNSCTLFVFDTVVTINAYCDDEMLSLVSERCEFFEETLSRTLEGSDVFAINNAGGQAVEVHEETAYLISQALEIAEETDGLFDITIGAVSSLWDFVEGVRPDDAAIQEALPHVDWRGVTVEGTTVQLSDPQAMIDLGGIAKGYIAQECKQMLVDAGVSSATINLGGDVTVLGTKPDGSQWNVGIQDPNGENEEVIASLRTQDSVITSGLYERSFTCDGTEYYHILDPKTGYPAQTDLESASIATGSPIAGDAYATTLFLLGRDRALELLDGDDRFEGLLIGKDGAFSESGGSDFVLL